MITERDIALLQAVARYHVLNRPQIQALCFPADGSGRATRRRLQALVSEHFINRYRLLVHHPREVSAGPVYYPAPRGCEFLAEYFDDERYLTTPTQPPQSHHVFHWLAVSETHLALDAAIARQNRVRLEDWLNEWDVVNKDESAPERRFRIYTLLRESPRLVCAPDAAFLLSVDSHKKVFYLEQDRDTSGVRRVAASKTPGFAELAQRGLHRRHFPESTVPTFTVLMIAPNARRRDALKKALDGKPGAELWRFAAAPELTPETFLYRPIFHPCRGEPMPLVRPDASKGDA